MASNNNQTSVTFKVFNQDFNKAIKEMKEESSKLRQEYKLQQEQMRLNGTETDKLSTKLTYLQEEQRIATKRVQETEQQLQRAKDMFGENSQEVATLSSQLTNARIAQQRYTNQVETTQRAIDDHSSATRTLNNLLQVTENRVEDFSHILGQRLVRSIQDGTATSRDLETAFQRIARESVNSSSDVERLRNSLQSIDDGNSIANVRTELQRIQTEAQEAEESVDDLGLSLENIAGAIGAGVGIKEVIDQALESSSLETQIDVSFNVPEESKDSVEEAVRGVVAYGIDGEEALEGVRRQWTLNKDASDETNAAVVKGAQTIAKAYNGVDFNELIQETNEISGSLGISNQEALALADSLLTAGFPPEQLDTVAEYGEQLHMAGYSAEDIQNIFAAGIDTKSWNIDNLMDGLKEGRIQMADFGNGLNKEMQTLISQTDISADKFVGWGKDIAKGGEDGQKAMQEATVALAGVEDATVRNQLGTKMFGTMWEDQGIKIIDTILNAKDGTLNLKDAQDELNRKTGEYDDDPAVEMQQAIQSLKESLAPTLSSVSEIVSKIMNWSSENPKLSATIVTIATGLGIFMGAIIALLPFIIGLSGAATTAGVSIGAMMVPLLPIIGIIAAVVLAITGLILIITNWGDITDWISDKWDQFTSWISEKTSKLATDAVQGFSNMKDGAVNKVTELKDGAIGKWEQFTGWVSDNTSKFVSNSTQKFTDMKNKAVEKVTGLKDGAIDKFNQFRTRTSEIVQGFKDKTVGTVSEAKTNAVNKVNDLKNGAIEKFNSLRSRASEIMQSTKDKILSPIESARDKIGGIVDKIKGFFTRLKLKIPTPSLPKLPHFSLKWDSKTLLGKEIKYPTGFGVEWYRNGGFFDEAQLIGIGEDGAEAAVPLVGKRMDPFADAVANRMLSSLPQMAESKLGNEISVNNNMNITVVSTLDGQEVARNQYSFINKMLGNESDLNGLFNGG